MNSVKINILQIHLFISGDVQGVGYRSWCRSLAHRLGLVGWVRNLPGGRVEIVAEGKKEILETFIDKCRQGPPVSWVENVETKWEPVTHEFKSFEMIY
jgi:acylphosphatase